MAVRVTYTGGRSKRIGPCLFKQGVSTPCSDAAVIRRVKMSPDFDVLEEGQRAASRVRIPPRPRKKVTVDTKPKPTAVPAPPKVADAKSIPDAKPATKKDAKKSKKGEEKKRAGLFRRRKDKE